MGRRTATLLVCGPLVAGCGAATPMHFAGHSRPATPVDVSVYSGRGVVRLDPSRVSAGPVILNIANQSGRTERFAVLLPGGVPVVHTPPIPSGANAQIKANLRGHGYVLRVSSLGRGMIAVRDVALVTSDRRRNGNDQLMQP